MSKTTKQIPRAALTLRDPACALTLDEPKAGERRRFSMVANSGGIIPNHWFWGNFAIDMAGLQIGRQKRPALRDHDSNRIVGHTESIRKDASAGLVAEGVFAKTPDADEVLSLADGEFPWEASIYVPPLSIEEVAAGATAEVNGQTLHGPGTIFRQSRLREVSFCALGADENTSAVALADNSETVEVEVTIKETDMDLTKLTAAQLSESRPDLIDAIKTEALKAAEATSAAALAEAKADTEKAVLAERERAASIVKDAVSFGLAGEAQKLVSEGIDTKAAVDRLKDAKIAALQANAPKPPGPSDDPATATDDASGLSDEEQWKREWSKKPEVRSEFQNCGRDEESRMKAFFAWKKAEKNGRAKVLARK